MFACGSHVKRTMLVFGNFHGRTALFLHRDALDCHYYPGNRLRDGTDRVLLPLEDQRFMKVRKSLLIYRRILDGIVASLVFIMVLTLLGSVAGLIFDLVGAFNAVRAGVPTHTLSHGLIDSVARDLVIDVLSVFVLIELFRTFGLSGISSHPSAGIGGSGHCLRAAGNFHWPVQPQHRVERNLGTHRPAFGTGGCANYCRNFPAQARGTQSQSGQRRRPATLGYGLCKLAGRHLRAQRIRDRLHRSARFTCVAIELEHCAASTAHSDRHSPVRENPRLERRCPAPSSRR